MLIAFEAGSVNKEDVIYLRLFRIYAYYVHRPFLHFQNLQSCKKGRLLRRVDCSESLLVKIVVCTSVWNLGHLAPGRAGPTRPKIPPGWAGPTWSENFSGLGRLGPKIPPGRLGPKILPGLAHGLCTIFFHYFILFIPSPEIHFENKLENAPVIKVFCCSFALGL